MKPKYDIQKWLMVLLLLGAAGLRIIGLNNGSPPGLEHDEVANWLIDRAILSGDHAVYFTAAYGHEAGFHYWQTLFIALLGDNVFALRLPAAFVGLLLVAVSFAVSRRLFDRNIAFTTAALLTVLFFPVFYSRLGLRAITLPLVAGLALYCFWRGLEADAAKGNRWLAVAGIMAGASLYTYSAGRSLPFFFIGYLVYLLIWHRPVLQGKTRGIILFGLLFVVSAFPLYSFLRLNPGAETRVDEVRAPLDALLSGDLLPVLQNSWRILLGFGWQGDPLWRQNVAPQPIFEPLTAILFYGGLALSLWRWRDRRYGLLLLWLLASISPSIVTIDAPSTIRISNSLLILTLFPALVMHSLPSLSPEIGKLSTEWPKLLLLGLVLLNGGRTINYTFWQWPANDEVRFVWQESLTAAAEMIDSQESWQQIAVGGWTPDTMDAPTMALSLRRDDLQLRHFQPEHSLVIPAGEPTAIIVNPTPLPIHPLIREFLVARGMQSVMMDGFDQHQLELPISVTPQMSQDILFAGELRFLGFEPGPGCTGEGWCELVSIWRVEAQTSEPRRLFLHQLNETGEIVAQADGLDAPARFWQVGDIILQVLAVPAGPGDTLRLGVYNPLSEIRLLSSDNADSVLITLP